MAPQYLSRLNVLAFATIVMGWVLWLAPFVHPARRQRPAVTTDRRARWGILAQGLAYALLWQGKFWLMRRPLWREIVAVAAFAAAIVLSRTATAALGWEFRLDAALGADHHLVRSGPYRILRHPIYSSMACVLIGTGILVAPWPLFIAALIVFVIGTEIRVRVEDRLLLGAFGDEFRAYHDHTSAYVPGIR